MDDNNTTTTTHDAAATAAAAAAAAATPNDHGGNDEPHLIRSRVANACDGCKARKVKCDGKLPCSYCTRRQRPHTCKYSPPRQRRHPRPRTQPRTPSLHSPSASAHSGNEHNNVHIRPLTTDRERSSNSATAAAPGQGMPDILPDAPPPVKSSTSHTSLPHSSYPNQNRNNHHHEQPQQQQQQHHHHHHNHSSDAVGSAEDHEEAEVPREARLLCDAQGKLIFIGDCAPLSFFQTVRQLVTSRVDPNAFAPQTSRYSVLENATSKSFFTSGGAVSPPEVDIETIPSAVSAYLSVTSGMVDLFVNEARLTDDITFWVTNNLAAHHHHHQQQQQQQQQQQPHHVQQRSADDVASAVNYLVLALGTQQRDEDRAQLYFEYARDQALATLNGSLSIETVQAFILVTLYMLCACQINGAFLFFGIAVRAAYSIGVHRTEVNSRFGHEIHRHRDRIWKSLRIVDLFLSTSMGRPPCVSDVDCTVPYRQVDSNGVELFDILNASVQIFLILEGIVLEVYSRRKITFQLTEGISRQLRDFSVRWLHQLKKVVSSSPPPTDESEAEVNGACQVLATYYYAVMLVSRPFLMYELYRRLSPEPAAVYGRAGLVSGKSKLADACIDAASMMVDQILDLIEKGAVTGRRPILVSWLFAGSLVLGAGLLGSFGRVLEKYARMSLTSLDHFAKIDAHAAQYAMISKSLLSTALEYLEKKEVQERLQRTESSAQLFGLLPHEHHHSHHHHHRDAAGGVRRPSPDLSRKMVSSPTGMVTTAKGEQQQHQRADSNAIGGGGGVGETSSSVGDTTTTTTTTTNNHPSASTGSFGMGSPFFSDLDPAFLNMSGNLSSRSPDLSLMNTMFDGDESNFGGLNLFPLLETGGGGHIDLAHYL